jgi:hypothetical protein
MRLLTVCSLVVVACLVISAHPRAFNLSSAKAASSSSMISITNSCRTDIPSWSDSNANRWSGVAANTKVISGPNVAARLREKLQGPKGIHRERSRFVQGDGLAAEFVVM